MIDCMLTQGWGHLPMSKFSFSSERLCRLWGQVTFGFPIDDETHDGSAYQRGGCWHNDYHSAQWEPEKWCERRTCVCPKTRQIGRDEPRGTDWWVHQWPLPFWPHWWRQRHHWPTIDSRTQIWHGSRSTRRRRIWQGHCNSWRPWHKWDIFLHSFILAWCLSLFENLSPLWSFLRQHLFSLCLIFEY